MYTLSMKTKVILGIITIVTLIGSFYLVQRNIQNEALKNTQWILIEGKEIDLETVDVQITLNFESSQQISGYSGVNQYGGSYQLKSQHQIEFKDLYSTLMASIDPVLNEIEGKYMSLLAQMEKYQISENELILLDKDNTILLRFEAKN
jgi:heat shock protein HslJ